MGIANILEEMERFTPDPDSNLVGQESLEPTREQLGLVGHLHRREHARAMDVDDLAGLRRELRRDRGLGRDA